MTLTLPYQPTFIVADGTTKSFNYLFDSVSDDFIDVVIKRTDGSVYQPVFVKDLDRQTITLTDSESTPELGALVCIYRNTPEVQDVAFRTLEGYNAHALENILSKIVAMIQETRDVADHTTIRTTFPQRDVSIQVITDEDDEATVIIDAQNKQLKRGLYFKIADGNLMASADGQTFIQMPKSANIKEFRQIITKDNHYVFQYRVDNEWHALDFGVVENTANDAKEKAESAVATAETALETANSASEVATGAANTVKTFEDSLKQEKSDRVQADKTLQSNIDTEQESRISGDTNLQTQIDMKADKTALGEEVSARAGADENLQSQLDAMAAASDVADVVGTYADLQAYDTSKLTDNAIIKVLKDETQDGASTYYRWTIGA